jgi:fibronectin-binding autotransporter adhesin
MNGSSLSDRRVNRRNYRKPCLLAAAAIAGLTANSAIATVSNWTSTSDTTWNSSGNWSNGVPGALSGTTNSDTALFNLSTTVVPVIDSGRNIENITFDTSSVGALTLGTTGGNSLLLTSGGIIQMNSTVANTETINAPLVIEGTSGTYTFTNNSTTNTKVLNFGGAISGGASGNTVLTFNGTNTGTDTISGVISNGSATTLGLTMSGSGSLSITGTNTYTGPTTVTSGQLNVAVASSQAFGINSALTITSPGAVNIPSGDSTTIGSLTGNGNMNLNGSTLTVGGDNTSPAAYTGAIAGGSGGATQISKVGTGILTLGGNSTFTGSVNIGAGILNDQSTNGLGAFTSHGVTVVSGATLQLQGGVTFNTKALQVAGTGASGQNGALVNVSGTNIYQGAVTVAGTGAGTTYLSSDSGSLTLSGGFSSGSNSITFTGAGNGALNGTVSMTGILTKTGIGLWDFAGSTTTFTNSIHVNQGIVAFANGGLGTGTINFGGGTLRWDTGNTQDVSAKIAFNSTSSPIAIDTNGNALVTFGSNLVNNNGGLSKLGVGTLALTAACTYTGSTTTTGGSLQLGNGSTTGSIPTSSTITDNADFAIDRSNPVAQGTDFSGSAITGGGTFSQVGSGTTTLSAANAYSGGTNVLNGTLIASGSTTGSITNGPVGTGTIFLGAATGSNNATLSTDSTAGRTLANPFTLVSGNSGVSTIAALNTTGTDTFSGNITLGSGSAGQSVTLGATGGGEVDITGKILQNASSTGNVAVGKLSGSGTAIIRLTGSSNYTGTTTVGSGELVLSGSGSINGSSGITVNGSTAVFLTNSSTAVTPTIALTSSGGGTVGGSGTINSALTVNTGTHLAPGFGLTGTNTTTLTLGNALNVNSGANMDFRLSTSTSGSNDGISISGSGNSATIANSGTLNVTCTGAGLSLGNYVLINDPLGTINGGAGNAPTLWTFNVSGDSGHTYSFVDTGTQLDLNVANIVLPTLTWNGNSSSAWNSADVNWNNGSTNVAFSNGSPTVFQDAKGGGGGNVTNNNISITTTGGVSPASVVFSNTSGGVAYTITSSDSTHQGITGSTGIMLNGTGNVTLAGTNTFTGTITINGGVLNGTTASINGGSTSNGITFGGGTLQAGGAITTAKAVTLSTAGTVDVNGNAVALSGNISGSNALNVTSTAGSGSLTLTGSNSYTDTNVAAGVTVISGLSANTNTLGTGTVSLASGAKLALQGQTSGGTSPTQTYVNNLTLTGNATVDVSGSLAATMGNLSIGSSKLSLTSADGTTGAYSLTLGNVTFTGTTPSFDVAASSGGGAGTLVLGALNDQSVAQSITLNPTSTGTITLSTNATSLGVGTVVNINHGTVNSNTTSAMGSTATVNMSTGAVLNVNASQTVSALDGAAGSVNIGNNILTVGSTDNLSSNFGGLIAGTGNVVASGTGTLTLSGANTYGGKTVNSNGQLIPTSTLINNNGSVVAAGPSVVTNGVINSDPVGTAAVLINSGGKLYLDSTPGRTLPNNIYGTSTGSTASTVGALNASGTSTFSGNVTLGTGSSGDFSHNLIVAATNGGEVDFTGNILANGSSTSSVTVNSLSSPTGNATVGFTGNNTYTGGTTVNPNATLAAGPSINSTEFGTGTVKLAGGNVALRGVLPAGVQQVVTMTPGSFNADTIVDQAATSGSASSTSTPTSNIDGGSLFYEDGYQGNASNGVPVGGTIPAAGTFHAFQIATDPSTHLLTVNNTLRFPNGSSTGTLTLATPAQYQSLDFLATSNNSATFSVTLDFATGLPDTIGGFTTSDWYGGNAGHNAVTGLNPAQQSTSAVFNYGGALTMQEYDLSVPLADQSRTITGIAISGNAAGQSGDIFAVSGATAAGTTPLSTQSYANNFNVTGSSGIDVSGSLAATIGTLTIGNQTLSITSADTTTSAYSLTTGTVSFQSTGATFNVANSTGGGPGSLILGAINDNGNAQHLLKTGAGTLVLSQAAIAISEPSVYSVVAGTLASNNANALNATGGTGFHAAGISVASGATFSVGASQQIDNLKDYDAIPVVNGASVLLNGNTLTVGSAQDRDSSFSGVISDGVGGAGTVAKVGGGTMTLAGSSTYTGGTSVVFGALVAANTTGSATGTGAVSVTGGALGGTGIISGAVTVTGSGKIFAGIPQSHSVLNNYAGKVASTLTIGTGSSLLGTTLLDLTAAPNAAPALESSDEITVGAGSLTLGGTLNVTNPNSITFAVGQSYDLFGFGVGNETGTFGTMNLPPLSMGETWVTTALYTNGIISIGSSGPNNLTWNNTGGTGDGTTWASGTTPATLQNWQNGATPSFYSDSPGDNVTFNDTNNSNYAVTINTVVTPGSTIVNTTGAYVFSGTGGIGGSGSLTKSGTGSLTLSTSDSYTGGTNVTGGTLNIEAVSALPTASALSISSGATVVVDRNGNSRITLDLASLSNSGTINLKDNRLVIHNVDQTTADNTTAAVFTQLHNGFANGTWAGGTSPSILSSTAAGSSLYTLGEVESGTDVLVRYAYYGDANLDGTVDGTDYSLIDTGFGSAGALTGWQNGDFNYDGHIDGSDYSLIDNAFNTQTGTAPAVQIATNTSEIAGGSAAVPEPASLGLLGIGAIGLMSSRRRRRA